MTRSLPVLPQPGETFDRYEIVAEVAHGGMAAVYAARLAQKSGVRKLLALKVLLPHLAADERFVAMFLDEARIAAHIDHPNVVQLFEVGEHHARPYLVMEFLRGQSLAALLRRAHDGGISTARLLAILADVARGLHGAHEAREADGPPLGVVHRDVSPQNVHVSYSGRVRVIDFGIAAAAGRVTTTRSDEVKGKIAYMAPEQLHRRDPIDRRTDLWSLGVMAWQAFAGQPLFRGENDADTMFNVLNREVPDIQGLRADLPDEAATILMRCLSRAPAERPADAALVAEALSRAAAAAGLDAAEPLEATMTRLFATDMAVEEERLASAMRDAPPPPLKEPESTSGRARVISDDATTAVRRPRASRRMQLALAALVLVGVVGIGSFVVLGGALRPASSAAVAPEPTAALAAPPVVTLSHPEVETALAPATPVSAPPTEATQKRRPSARHTHHVRAAARDVPNRPAERVGGHGGLLPVPL